MGLLAIVQSRKMQSMFFLFVLPIIVSCHSNYTTQHFCFPPGSVPHEDGWQYTALVTVSSRESPITNKSEKNVQIKVYNKDKEVFLDDNFEFVSASINANIIWEKYEEIKVNLIEVGNEYAKDPYNNFLIKTGPKKLLQITYRYDQEKKWFQKANN